MTTLSVTVDGVPLNTLAYDIELSSSRRSVAGGRTSDIVLPGVNGVFAGPVASEAKDFAISMWVIGADASGNVPTNSDQALALYEANLDTLLGLFGTRHRTQTIQMVVGDGTTRVAQGRVVDAVAPREDLQGAVPLGKLTVVYELVESFWRSPSTVGFTQTFTAGGTWWMPQFDGSNAPAEDLLAVVDGPITNPKVTAPSTGSWVSYKGSIPAGQSWTIKSETWATTINDVNVIRDISYGGFGSRFLTFAPERNGGSWRYRVSVSGSGMGAGTGITVQGRKAYQ